MVGNANGKAAEAAGALQIAADGRVDEMERQIYGTTMDELREVVQAAIQLIYAEGGGA